MRHARAPHDRLAVVAAADEATARQRLDPVHLVGVAVEHIASRRRVRAPRRRCPTRSPASTPRGVSVASHAERLGRIARRAPHAPGAEHELVRTRFEIRARMFRRVPRCRASSHSAGDHDGERRHRERRTRDRRRHQRAPLDEPARALDAARHADTSPPRRRDSAEHPRRARRRTDNAPPDPSRSALSVIASRSPASVGSRLPSGTGASSVITTVTAGSGRSFDLVRQLPHASSYSITPSV